MFKTLGLYGVNKEEAKGKKIEMGRSDIVEVHIYPIAFCLLPNEINCIPVDASVGMGLRWFFFQLLSLNY